MVIMVSKRKRRGIYQGQYYIGIFVVGVTAFAMGAILLIVSSTTNLLFNYAFFLIVTGVIALLISLVARKIWEKKVRTSNYPHTQ